MQNSLGKWRQVDECGAEYGENVYDSSQYSQKIEFNYEFEVEVRHALEPEFVFEEVTDGYGRFEEKPENEYHVAIILLCFSLVMLAISIWRLYDYVHRKYIQKYLNAKRIEKYLIQQEFENEERLEQ